MAKLFIVGIPRDMDEVELVELFSAHGMVNTVTVVTDKNTGESKGYGFINMADNAGAERAIAALDQAEIDGRTVSVRFAQDKVDGGGEPNHVRSMPPHHVATDLPKQRGKRPRLPKR